MGALVAVLAFVPGRWSVEAPTPGAVEGTEESVTPMEVPLPAPAEVEPEPPTDG